MRPEPFPSPLEIDDGLAGWLAAAVDPALAPRLRFDRLLTALRDPDSPGFVERVSPTLSANASFRDRRINFVSFAFLVVALARSLDLPAYFVLVPETLARQRNGGLAIEEQHLAAAIWLWHGLTTSAPSSSRDGESCLLRRWDPGPGTRDPERRPKGGSDVHPLGAPRRGTRPQGRARLGCVTAATLLSTPSDS